MNNLNNPFMLSNKKILVTGASSGIGKSIAIILSQGGATLYINGRNEDRLSETFRRLIGNGHKMIIGDLTDEIFISHLTNEIPNIDGIVHASGIMQLLPFKFVNKSVLGEMMNVNFTAPILLTLNLLKSGKINKNCAIVFITSINGSVIGSKANSIYAASKGALNGMIKSMAIDLAKSGIRVNNIAPGMIETEGTNDIAIITSVSAVEEDKKKYPLGCYGTPEDVAYACQFLLADASKWITGTTLVIDGGFTIQ